jgi:hypothetical protein
MIIEVELGQKLFEEILRITPAIEHKIGNLSCRSFGIAGING